MASTNIDTGSAGVMRAATMSMATKAYLRPRRSAARSTTPRRNRASITVGNSNTSPFSSTIEVNMDMYEPRLMVLTTSVETV